MKTKNTHLGRCWPGRRGGGRHKMRCNCLASTGGDKPVSGHTPEISGQHPPSIATPKTDRGTRSRTWKRRGNASWHASHRRLPFTRRTSGPKANYQSLHHICCGNMQLPSPGIRLRLSGHLSTVRFVGEVQGTRGTWLGVEWDDPSRGKHDGMKDGVRYFTCL